MEVDMSGEWRIRGSIVEALVQNYPLLSQAQEVNSRVATASDNALSCVERLGDSLGKLQVLSRAMGHVGELWRREKQVALGTVERHHKLLSFLEAPAVLRECIRSEMYHEALAVLEHVRRSAQPAEGVALLRRVEDGVHWALQRSLDDLVLPRLAGQLTVASAVRLTTFLRRLGVEDSHVRQLFLLKRREYVDGHMHDAELSGAPYSSIFRYLTTFKVHVSEVVLHYNACFSLDSDDNPQSELTEWCHEISFVFGERVRACLTRIASGSELASIIEQCSNCVSTTSSVHMDIFGVISEAISERVKSLFAEQLTLATQSYSASMATFSWRPPTGPHQQALQRSSESAVTSSETSAPPVTLLQWVPLAYALNGILAAFNSIRKCVIPGIEYFCVARVEELVRVVAKDLARDRDLLIAVEGNEKRAYLLFIDAFMHEFCPHVLVSIGELIGDAAKRELDRGLRFVLEDLRNLLLREDSIPPKGAEQSPNSGVPCSDDTLTPACRAEDAAMPRIIE